MGHGLSTDEAGLSISGSMAGAYFEDAEEEALNLFGRSSTGSSTAPLEKKPSLAKPSKTCKDDSTESPPPRSRSWRKAVRSALFRRPRGSLRRHLRSILTQKEAPALARGASPAGWTEQRHYQSEVGSRQAYLARLGIRQEGLVEGQLLPPSAKSAFSGVADSETEKAKDCGGLQESQDRLDGPPCQEVKPPAAAPAGFVQTPGDLRGDFRMSFLRRLSYEHVWVPTPQRPRKHSTLIVLDWDDTLLCTSFLSCSRQLMSCSGPMVHRRLEGVARAACQLVELAKSLGETFIITNAASNWVQDSAKKYLPSLLPLIADLEVISARQRYESLFPNKVAEWKAQAFLEVKRRRSPESITNLISIGDSSFEMDAALAIGELCPQAIVKTVKFREQPSPEELAKELLLAGERLKKIVESGRALQVAMERKPLLE